LALDWVRSLAGIDKALKRYALGVDEWKETMRSLKDAEEEVGNLFVCLSFSFFRRVLYFFRVTRLIKASNSKNS